MPDDAGGREAAEELEAEAHAESERAIEHHDRPPAPMIQTGDGVRSLEDLEPQAPDERLVAASAVGRLRRYNAGRELWERLGTFESELVARAFAAGARAQAERLERAIGAASATVDGPTLRRLNAGYPMLRPDERVELAEQAHRYAEASHEAPAALRLVAVERVRDELVELLRAHHVAEDVGEAADVGEELDLVDRLRRTIDELEDGVNRLTIAAAGVELEAEEAP